MAEEQLQLQNSYTTEQLAEIEKRGLSWKLLGEGAAKLEMYLLENSDSMIKRAQKASIILTIEDVQLAEQVLKNLTSDYIRSEEERKKVTTKFDKLNERFMAPNKAVQPHITKLRSNIVEFKTTLEKAQKAVEEKGKEVIYVKEYLLNQANAFDAACKTKIANKISSSYKYALDLIEGKPRVRSVDKLKEHIAVVESHLTIKDFIFSPVSPKLVYLNELEYANMVLEIEVPTDYVALFKNDIKQRYHDYETAVSQVEKALELDRKESADKEKAIAEELKNKDIAAKLEAIAVPIVEKTEVKALKKSYAIDMEETKENAMKIMGAFIANFPACCEHIRLKNWFNISPTNMIGALQKLKNDDNAFECTGIVWKEVSKL